MPLEWGGAFVSFARILKFTLFPLLLLLLAFIFYKPIVNTALGAAAKWVLSSKLNCKCAYRSLVWEQGQIAVSDLVLFGAGEEQSPFHAHIEKASIRFDWSQFPKKCKGHLVVDRPRIILTDSKNWPKAVKEGHWFDLTLSMREGTIDIPGIEKANFYFEKTAPGQIGRLKMEWGCSGLYLEGRAEGEEWGADAAFKQLDAVRLQSILRYFGMKWEGVVQEGILDGWTHFVWAEGKWKRSSAHLELKNVSFDSPRNAACNAPCHDPGNDWCVWKGIDGTVDWDGVSFGEKKGLIGDFLPEHLDGHLRISLNRLGVATPLGAVEGIKGDLTYNSGVGAKWEMEGIGSARGGLFPLKWKGRVFLHSQRTNWLETELGFEDAAFLVKGREEEEGTRIWTASVRGLQTEQATLLQAFAAVLFPEANLDSYCFASGVLNGEGTVKLSDGGNFQIGHSRFATENLFLHKGKAVFGCQKGEVHFSSEGGECFIIGGAIEVPLPQEKMLIGKEWGGKCIWEKGVLRPSYFSGWFETAGCKKVQASLKADGKGKQWNVEADLGGFLAGRLLLQIEKEEENWRIRVEPSEVEGIVFNGEGWIDPDFCFSFSAERFRGRLNGLEKIWEGSFSGRVESIEKGLQIRGDPNRCEWSLQAKVEQAGVWSKPLKIENMKGEIDASSDEISFLKMEGEWSHANGKLHFSCPQLIRKRGDWIFDLRFDSGPKETWDLSRLSGFSDGEKVVFDEKKSHFLGTPLHFKECCASEGKITEFGVEGCLPWNALLAAGPCLQKWGISSWSRFPAAGSADIRFHYSKDGGSELFVRGVDLRWKEKPISLDVHALQQGEREWKIDRCLLADFTLSCLVREKEGSFRIEKGNGSWKTGLKARFEGKITPDFHCDFFLSSVQVDLNELGSLPYVPVQKLEGMLEGQGRFSYSGNFESDFDLSPSSLKAGPFILDNQGPVQLYFSSEKGVFVRGLDFRLTKPEESISCDCKIDLLQFDTARSHWILNHSQFRLPSQLLGELQKRPQPSFFRWLDEKQDLYWIADLDCATDFSTFSCCMKEGLIPIGGVVREIKDLHLFWDEKRCSAEFQTFHKGHHLSIGLDVGLEPKSSGFFTVREEGVPLEEDERPLKIEWDHSEKQGFSVQSIDGSFSGINASFHAEINPDCNTLIGSARLDFQALSDFVPPKILELVQELKMGKGYELKGRLKFEEQKAFFNGILSGKQLDLFGYQFRTLLAQIDIKPDFVRIYDLKISDSAGIMKIEEIEIKEKPNSDWTLLIPQLTILELRPCLLQKPGKEPGPLSPLVVRELKITDFQGILDDSKTYTAKGNLNFINSYKRDYSVFDLPADVLSRIVGLDLELLIPVMGKLDFELKDRKFRLMELKDAYSESRRSEFFLEKEEGEPFMDLDGQLKILVRMKQFVLFKFTEAFLISIDGTLSDPQYRLQKKRRFFGMQI